MNMERKLITEYYSTPVRYYHTYEHAFRVAHSAQHLAEENGLTEEQSPDCYIAGIWHDAVYVVGNKDNEEQSAQMLLLRHPLKTVPANLVRRTTVADHLSEEIAWENDPMQCCLLDADLISLSLRWIFFMEAQRNIAKEHGLDEVTLEHAKFLTQFLDKKRIYRCPGMYSYEKSARANIEQLLNEARKWHE